MAPEVSMKQLLEAGVHFGHQKRRWNPKMARFIFGERNGIYILDLQKTVKRLKNALHFVHQIASGGGSVLFVGTKKQAQQAVADAAASCNSAYVNQRWLGGTLTNFTTLRRSLARFRALKRNKQEGRLATLPRHEMLQKEKELLRSEKALGGIENLNRLPEAIFIVDPHKERTAVLEAIRLQISIIALVDTNCDPDEIDFPIPSNDDAIRAVRLMCGAVAETIRDGRSQADAARQAAKAEKEETAQAEEKKKDTAETPAS
jgi:small subunit ribosomal protein S2